jgi:hypothetical protein
MRAFFENRGREQGQRRRGGFDVPTNQTSRDSAENDKHEAAHNFSRATVAQHRFLVKK